MTMFFSRKAKGSPPPAPPRPPLPPSPGRYPPSKPNSDQALLEKLAAFGVQEVQLHEPALVMWDSSQALAAMFKTAYFAKVFPSNQSVNNSV